METLKERLEEQKARHQGGPNGSAPPAPRRSAPTATTPKASASARTATAMAARSRFGTSASSATSTTTSSSACGTRDGAAPAAPLRARGRRRGARPRGTIRETAQQGLARRELRPERRNAVKVLLFLDVGGSMDGHVRLAEELFSAARAEFKHLEHFYFHNCLYEGVWRDNRRRSTRRPRRST